MYKNIFDEVFVYLGNASKVLAGENCDMNILAGTAEMFAWTEALFADVPKEVKEYWDVIKSPISTDMGVIQISVKDYQPKVQTVGDYVDAKVNFKEGTIEIRTYFKEKTLVFSSTMKVGSVEIVNSTFSPQKG